MIVVDASVLVTVLTDQGHRATAIERRLDQEELAAPELLDVEVMSGMRRLVATGRVASSDAQRGLVTLAQAPIERFAHRGLLGRAWDLRENLSAYDALYVALAEVLEVSLLTRDARLARATGIRCAVELIS